MKSLRSILKQVNDASCADDGLLLGACKASLNGNKNYVAFIGGAMVAQYVLPIVMLLIISPYVFGTAIAVNIIEFLRMFNPFFVVLYLPVTFNDAMLVSGVLITFMIGSTVFWYFYFREIGSLMFIPLASWLVAILIWFIPIIGPMISVIASLFPWLPVMSALHWHVYK